MKMKKERELKNVLYFLGLRLFQIGSSLKGFDLKN